MQNNYTATRSSTATTGLMPTGKIAQDARRKSDNKHFESASNGPLLISDDSDRFANEARLAFGGSNSFPYLPHGSVHSVGKEFRMLSRSYRPISYHLFCYMLVVDGSFFREVSAASPLLETDLLTCAQAHLVLYYVNSKRFREKVASSLEPQSGYFDPLGIKKATDIGERIVDSIDKLMEKKDLLSTSHTVQMQHMMPQLSNFFGPFVETMSLNPGGSKILFGLLTVSICGYAFKTLDKKAAFMITGLFGVFAAAKYGNEFIVEIVNPICDVFRSADTSDPEAVEPQFGAEATALPLALYLLGLCAKESSEQDIFLGKGPGQVKRFVKTIGEVPKLTAGLSLIVKWLSDTMINFVNSCADVAGWDPVVKANAMYPEIDQITKDLADIVKEFRAGAPYDYDHAQRIFELERRATKVVAHIPSSKDYAEYKRSAMQLLASIKPYVAKMERNNIVGNGPRREPLGIMLAGPTNVGKSTVTIPLLTAVNEMVLPKEKLASFRKNRDDHIWNFIPENVYHDSYHGQFNVIVDEAGSYHDAAGTPDAGAQGILRMINTANLPLHMAHLEDKGCTNFRSELIFATTNRTFFDWKSMYLPEAYARRFKVSYLQVPRAEYCTDATMKETNLWNRRMDLVKVVEAFGSYSMAVYEFHPYDLRKDATQRYLGPPIDFDTLVKVVVAQYKLQRERSDALLSFHGDIQKKYGAMRDAEDAGSEVPIGEPPADGAKVAEDIAHELGMNDDLKTRLVDLGRRCTMTLKNLTEHLYFSGAAMLDADTECEELIADMERFQQDGEPEAQIGLGGGFSGVSKDDYTLLMRDIAELNRIVCLTTPARTYMVTHPNEFVGMTKSQLLDAMYKVQADHFCLSVEEPTKSWRETCTNFFCNNKKLCLILAAISAFKLAWTFLGPALDPESGETKVSTTRAKKPARSSVIRRVGIHKVAGPDAQIGVTQNCWDMAKKIISGSSYKAVCEGRVMGYFTFVKGRLAIFPEHFSNHMEAWMESGEVESNPVITFTRAGSPSAGFQIRYDEAEWLVLEDSTDDVAYVNFPKVVHNHPDITRYFLSADDRADDGLFDSAFLRPDGDNFGLIVTRSAKHGQVKYGGYSCESTYKYHLQTRKGDCGSPLFLLKPNGAVKFAGIHVAGNGTLGYAAKIHEDNVRRVVEEIKPKPGLMINEEPVCVEQIGDTFLVREEVKPFRVPNRTAIIRSPLYGKWGPATCEPGYLCKRTLDDGTVLDPWASARAKYCRIPEHISVNRINLVSDAVVGLISYGSSHNDPWPPRVFSFEDACQGLDGVDHFNAIPRSKSAGYPFNLDAKGPGKSDWFGSDGDFDFSSPKCVVLRGKVESYVESMSRGERGNFLYADYLKDERKPSEKVWAGKGRLISAAPLDFLVMCRMYFGDFIRHCMKNKVTNSMAIGVNPYSSDWEAIARHVTALGDNVIAGDFSGYDGRLMPVVMYKFLEAVESYYTNSTHEEVVIRATLFEDIVNSRHVTVADGGVGFVYEFFGSNPSGNPLTTLLNCFCNLIFGYHASTECLIEGELDVDPSTVDDGVFAHYLETALEAVRMIVFGDDNQFGVSDRYAQHITQSKMTEAMSRLGLTYTNEDKSDVQHGHRKIADCSFLKRGFVYSKREGRVLAPLEMSVILESSYWTKKSNSDAELIACVETNLMELSIHGRETFDEIAPGICRSVRAELGHQVRTEWLYYYNKSLTCEAIHY